MSTRWFSTLSLFSSFSTLVCCALPALFVALGAGATLAHLLNFIPGLIWVSAHKGLVFGTAGAMLLIGGTALWYARRMPCPIDPVKAAACDKTRRTSYVTYFVSIVIYLTGGLFAFVL